MKITLSIMCYNQERFIDDTLRGAFSQDYPKLDIVVSDDNSSDRTFEMIRKAVDAYDGPHNVTINRNQPNLGLIGHVNYLFAMSGDSDLIVYNAGDDISHSNRVSVLAEEYRKTNALLLHSDVIDMDEHGVPYPRQRVRSRPQKVMEFDLARTAKVNSSCLGASCAWNPQIMDLFGPITEDRAIEDRVLYFRARLLDRAHYIDQRLLDYRREVGLTARKSSDTDFDLRYLRMDIASFRQRLKDTRKIAPDRADIIHALERKIEKRERQLAAMA